MLARIHSLTLIRVPIKNDGAVKKFERICMHPERYQGFALRRDFAELALSGMIKNNFLQVHQERQELVIQS